MPYTSHKRDGVTINKALRNSNPSTLQLNRGMLEAEDALKKLQNTIHNFHNKNPPSIATAAAQIQSTGQVSKF